MEHLSNYDSNQAMIDCVSQKSLISITKRNKTDWQIYKTQATSSSTYGNITIGDRHLIYGEKGHPSEKVGISFRQGNHKLLFNTILRNNTIFCPNHITKISRHSYKRQSLQHSIPVLFWTLNKKYHGQLIDFSTGGMQVSTSIRNHTHGPYSCCINHSITANVILQHDNLLNEKQKTLSFQFVGLEFDDQLVFKLVKFTQAIKRQHQNRCCLDL